MHLTDLQFPLTAELLQKHLFEQAAGNLEEAVAQYRLNGPEMTSALLQELHRLLNDPWTDMQLTEFIEQYSDYLVEGSGRAMLEFIAKILS